MSIRLRSRTTPALALVLFGAIAPPLCAQTAAQPAAATRTAGAPIGAPSGAGAAAALAARQPLEHHVYEAWDTIGGETISRDGQWVLYNRLRYDRDDVLVVRSATRDVVHVFDRAAGARFDESSGFVAFTLRPARESVLDARRERRPAAQMPRDTLGILDLATGAVQRVPAIRGFRMADAGSWIAWQLERPAGSASGAAAAAGARPPQAGGGGGQGAPAGQGAGQGAPAGQGPQPRRKEPGTPLVLRNLATGEERRLEDVAAYAFATDGRSLAYATSAADGAGDGVYLLDLATGTTTAVLTGEAEYRRLTFDEAGAQLAFLSNRDEWGAPTPAFALYHWQPRMAQARRVAAGGTAGLPAGWTPSDNGSVSFSRNGQRLFFAAAPRTEPEPADNLLAEERVRVEVWHWQDPLIQPVQNRRLQQDRRRSFDAVVHLRDGRVVQLGDELVPSVNVGARGGTNIAGGVANGPYAIESSWDSPGWADHYFVDVRTGERTLARERVQGITSLSPTARFAVWYDNGTRAWHAMDVRSRNVVNLTASIPHPVHNEDHDSPSPPSSYGAAGWLPNDAAVLVYDRFDVWAVDPTGRAAPRNVTQGAGRQQNLRFRLVRLDRDEDYLPVDRPALLSAFNPRTKQAGFHRVDLRGGVPQQLVMADYMFSTPRKAADADVLLFSRQSFTDFPDLWVSGLELRDMRRITAENPQQADYLWGSAELVAWTSLDGTPLQGILYRPEDFDPSRQYPMITYFYERLSDSYHLHYPPVPHRSRINPTFYTSRGYLVFVPDIVYRIGYPGESALNSIMPGVTKLVERGIVDRDRMALQGHSWGGYQIAFMVTRTNMFRAAAPGAPVGNMISAYSGIRLESGVGRQFQYERTQSRLGGNLWEMPIRYIENSPVFWLDKVETPLLIMHNDLDGAVPFAQGVELYLGLRRLGKPAWLINYVGEPHWPTTLANKRDWNIRMQQFFDHYLLDAPAPVWMRDGIPALQRGSTLGYELPAITADQRQHE
jgi:dipeptidyl aminopeptidase/acylaminoacyl peptidase